MGTRSITIVRDGDNRKIIEMYQQYDGYPDGVGKDLLDFIKGGEMGNGISGSPKMGEYFNGINDFAAQLIAQFKDRVGGLYLHAPTPDDTAYGDSYGAEYIYEIDSELNITCHSVYSDEIITMSYNSDGKFITDEKEED